MLWHMCVLRACVWACVSACVFAGQWFVHIWNFLVAAANRKRRQNVSRCNGQPCGFNAISHNKWPAWCSIIIIIIIIIVINMIIISCRGTCNTRWLHASLPTARALNLPTCQQNEGLQLPLSSSFAPSPTLSLSRSLLASLWHNELTSVIMLLCCECEWLCLAQHNRWLQVYIRAVHVARGSCHLPLLSAAAVEET